MIQKDPVKAKAYKNSFIPNKLFKYVSLYDNPSEDEKRFKSLSSGELHLGRYSDYNDPFEGTFLLIDEKELANHGWKEGIVTEIYRSLVDEYRICSLADTSEQNMPMWAYYANNHKGYCVEYTFSDKQKDYVFPVSYEKERQEATSQLANLIYDEVSIAIKSQDATVSEKLDRLNPESARTNVVIFLTIAAKHKSWSHEKEYRIIASNNHDSFPAIPSKIYAGMDCSKENLKRLTDIAIEYNKDGVPVELYKMKFDSNNKHFQLSKEKIV